MRRVRTIATEVDRRPRVECRYASGDIYGRVKIIGVDKSPLQLLSEGQSHRGFAHTTNTHEQKIIFATSGLEPGLHILVQITPGDAGAP